ncbi:hypothetical protein ACW14Y_42440 [Kitasatospora sp. cg17-2]
MSTRYLPVGPTDPEVFATPDYTDADWHFAAMSDLRPGPIADVLVAHSEDRDEQCDVQLLLDPRLGCSMRVRARHCVDTWVHESDEYPLTEVRDADLDGVRGLRISVYGRLGRLGLAAALREAAEMLETSAGIPRSPR